jgi:hypothetical protein
MLVLRGQTAMSDVEMIGNKATAAGGIRRSEVKLI